MAIFKAGIGEGGCFMRLTVGEISEVLGLSNETIRYYVREGLIKPRKNPENNYWEYSSEDVLVISDILFYRYLGISLSNIKKIIDGEPLFEIGDIIEETENEVREKIDTYNTCLENLKKWKAAYDEELSGIGKVSTTYMPSSLRIGKDFSEDEHLVHYLKGRIRIEKGDWRFVSLSFFCDIYKTPRKVYKYISLNKTLNTAKRNIKYELVEEHSEYCLATQVYYSEDIDKMILPITEYAKEKGIPLKGKIYGRERTNYYLSGERKCVYSIYAPIDQTKTSL